MAPDDPLGDGLDERRLPPDEERVLTPDDLTLPAELDRGADDWPDMLRPDVEVRPLGARTSDRVLPLDVGARL